MSRRLGRRRRWCAPVGRRPSSCPAVVERSGAGTHRIPAATAARRFAATAARPGGLPGRPAARILEEARGQATVEVVALLPVLVAVALAVLSVLAAGRARELAGTAAQAGAMALLREEDARAAARDVVPGHQRQGLQIAVDGRRVTVEVVPRVPLPGVASRLAATSTADAGPKVPR